MFSTSRVSVLIRDAEDSVLTSRVPQHRIPRREPLSPARNQPGGDKHERAIFDEFMAVDDFPGTATTIKLDRAERQAFLFCHHGQSPFEYNHCERREHGERYQRRPADPDAGEKKQAAEDFEPRESGCY